MAFNVRHERRYGLAACTMLDAKGRLPVNLREGVWGFVKLANVAEERFGVWAYEKIALYVTNRWEQASGGR